MLFDAFALDLANALTGVPRGASINCAAAPAIIAARHMRRHVAYPAVADEVTRVIRLVSPHRFSMTTRHAIEQTQGTRPLRKTIGMADDCTDHQTRAVLHQHVPAVAQGG